MHNTDHIQEEDAILLQGIQSGNRQAFDEVYSKYWALLFDAAFKRLPDYETCKDIVQEVFTDIWMRREKHTITSLKGFLLTAVKYQVFNHMRNNASRAHFLSLTIEDTPEEGRQADDVLLYREFAERLHALLDTLPAQKKDMFLKHYHDLLSTAQIAAEMQLSQKTIQNQLGQTRHYLKQHLGKDFLPFLTFLLLHR